MSSITPTIGRKVWLWHSDALQVRDDQQAFDAEVVFVHPNGGVSVVYRTHYGVQYFLPHVPLLDPTDDDEHGNSKEPYATWMPYQVGQARTNNVSS